MSDEMITSTELAVTEKAPRRHLSLRFLTLVKPSSGRRRVWSRMAALERDLDHTQQLNVEQSRLIEQLAAELNSAQTAAWNAIDRADELERQLQVAVEANEANSHRVDVIFEDRDVDLGDDATYPVPVVQMVNEVNRDHEDAHSLVTLARERAGDETSEHEIPAMSQSNTGTFHVVSLHQSPLAGLTPTNIPTTT